MSTASDRLRILLYGKDARTDAIARSLRASPRPIELHVYSQFRIPGLVEKSDGGIWDGNLTASGLQGMVAYAKEFKPDLAIVGPEEPLEAGLVDELVKLGIPCFGPSRLHAQIESSKSWTRQLMDEFEIPVNPEYEIFTDAGEVSRYLADRSDFVVKPDGLTGGKGVRLFPEHFESREEAIEYAEGLASESRVVIEERLEGEEFSLMSITDGETVVHCPAVQDHKRAYDGDAGPNTGGMGSYSDADHSLPFLTPDELSAARRTNEAVVRALGERLGSPYRGVLYGGFIATCRGVRLIEYNARFGDPEAMNVLPLLRGDFVEIAMAAATGNLASVPFEFAHNATVCKYLVPEKYPAGGGSGDEVVVPKDLRTDPDTHLYWAATNQAEDGSFRMTGSRALAVVGIGATIVEAERRAECAARAIETASRGTVRHRSDIGTADLLGRRTQHMEAVRRTGARTDSGR
ncbi:MAG: phosphoribosylamine--glycine ligase [Acidimicrobiales bacterium]|nr:phosphoribosylamine--glycine ligase [Acidimicrobiales bacterium]